MTDNPGGPTRRTVLAVATVGAAGAAAGCESYGEPTSAPPPNAGQQPGGASPSGASPSGASPGGESPAAPAAPPLAQVADIPVGGGTVFADAKVVVTQPEAGTVKAFSVACTHQGCAVSEVSDGTINCTCHGSKFRVADGSVAAGPARAPLQPVNVAVQDGAISLA
jgi:Rieske Fe-S protein